MTLKESERAANDGRSADFMILKKIAMNHSIVLLHLSLIYDRNG